MRARSLRVSKITFGPDDEAIQGWIGDSIEHGTRASEHGTLAGSHGALAGEHGTLIATNLALDSSRARAQRKARRAERRKSAPEKHTFDAHFDLRLVCHGGDAASSPGAFCSPRQASHNAVDELRPAAAKVALESLRRDRSPRKHVGHSPRHKSTRAESSALAADVNDWAGFRSRPGLGGEPHLPADAYTLLPRLASAAVSKQPVALRLSSFRGHSPAAKRDGGAYSGARISAVTPAVGEETGLQMVPCGGRPSLALQLPPSPPPPPPPVPRTRPRNFTL